MLETPLTSGRNRVLGSVFSPASPSPSPQTCSPASLALGLKSLNPSSRSADSFAAAHRSDTRSSDATECLIDDPPADWDRAWHIATAFLAIPDRGFGPLLASGDSTDETEFLRQWNRHGPPSKEASDALAYLLRPLSRGEGLRAEKGQGNILVWYEFEMRRHFLKNFRDGLLKLLRHPEPEETLQKIVHCLQLARHLYFSPFLKHVLPLLDTTAQEKAFLKLQRSFHMMVSYVVPWFDISTLVYCEIAREALVILGIDALNEAMYDVDADDMDVDRPCSFSYRDWRDQPSVKARMQMMAEGEDVRAAPARDRLLSLLSGLQLVGFGGDKAQKVFASVMNAMMTEFVRVAYSHQWEGPTLVPQHLRHWVENVFARLVAQVLAVINAPESGAKSPDRPDVDLSDVEKWQEVGIARLGALRTSELFDVIVEWPDSSGAIEDLRHFIIHPAARYYLTHSFVNILISRLLHPGASTSEILQLYISIIRAFNLLDPRGVLLDRIARPIRRYLRDRDDTVKVIVSGLLADPTDADQQASSGEILTELSTELARAHQRALQSNTAELDWDDMHWTPDPVDAAPDYRKPKNSDVIGSVTSLFESKEMFVKEMQSTLADRLLQRRGEDFDQELSVLELLKLRFGDTVLQACEVMLRDIFDSRRVDAVVRHDQGLSKRRASPSRPGRSPKAAEVPELHAKILSHFFWPEIREKEFKVPDEISALQQRYAAGFESLKQSRKLTWLNGLGRVTVELDLEDRVFVDEVTTWQATVIYAFQAASDEPVTKTTAQLSDELEMAPSFVRSACLFWVSKRILSEVRRETFRVLEVLPHDGGGASGGRGASGMEDAGDTSAETAQAAAAADAAASAAAKESAEAAAMEKMNVYWQFIVGMLTNQGAMPLQQIVMMLKMAVPGGFPFSNEELREFLAGMVSRGKLEIMSGGSYKIVG
ncbi:Anaphase-promoting complex subunit [Aspergillus sp. HF37]|nr:Anaphase-promoting complex subunit [Aspergillus sp. HF37]